MTNALAAIKAAAETLPPEQQEELVVFLVRSLRVQFGQSPEQAAAYEFERTANGFPVLPAITPPTQETSRSTSPEDPLLAVMGAFPSASPGPNGRQDEEILYGRGAGPDA